MSTMFALLLSNPQAERITAEMTATHEWLRESKRDREVMFNFLYKVREARIGALRGRLLPIIERMPTARAECARGAHQKCAGPRS